MADAPDKTSINGVYLLRGVLLYIFVVVRSSSTHVSYSSGGKLEYVLGPAADVH